MKIAQSTLSTNLALVAKALPSQSTLPIATHIYMDVQNDGVTLAATNLEMFVVVAIPMQLEEQWSCCTPGRLFTRLINALDGEIELTLDGSMLTISHNGNDSEINTMPTDEFPLLPTIPEVEPVAFETSEMAYLISRTHFAAAQDEARPTLVGVHFEFWGNELWAAATDGYRMSYVEYSLSVNLKPVTVKAYFLKELASTLNKAKGKVNLYTTETQAFFELPNMLFVSQLVVGNFPDVKNILPKEHKTKIQLVTSEFLQALAQLEVFAESSENVVVIEYQDGMVHLFADGGESGQADANLDAKTEGDYYKTAFNVTFMKDVLLRIGPECVIKQNGPNTPIVVCPVDKESEYINTIMPMAVREKS